MNNSLIQKANGQATIREILPKNSGAAIQKLMKITSALLEMSSRETQALLQNDMVSFSILQDEKEVMVTGYEKASQEFRARLNEFRGTDKTLLDRLELLQNTLGEVTKSNDVLVKRIEKNAKKNTQKTLLTVQELGQERPVKFENNIKQDNRGA